MSIRVRASDGQVLGYRRIAFPIADAAQEPTGYRFINSRDGPSCNWGRSRARGEDGVILPRVSYAVPCSPRGFVCAKPAVTLLLRGSRESGRRPARLARWWSQAADIPE